MEMRRASTILGCGCAVVIVFFLAAVLTVTWSTYRAGRDFERLTRDPEAAAARAREVVGFGELPEGYRAFGALSVPFLLDVAFFMAPLEEGGGGEVAAGVEIGEAAPGEEELRVDRGFLYVRLRDWMGRGEELRRELLAEAADDAPLTQEGLDFDPTEVVGRGELESGEAKVAWLARRGRVRIDTRAFGDAKPRIAIDDRELQEVDDSAEAGTGAGGGGDGPIPGVLAVLAIDCPGEDSWHRLGVWFVPDPAPDLPVAEVDWSGGPGDPAAIADLLGGFELCG